MNVAENNRIALAHSETHFSPFAANYIGHDVCGMRFGKTGVCDMQ